MNTSIPIEQIWDEADQPYQQELDMLGKTVCQNCGSVYLRSETHTCSSEKTASVEVERLTRFKDAICT